MGCLEGWEAKGCFHWVRLKRHPEKKEVLVEARGSRRPQQGHLKQSDIQGLRVESTKGLGDSRGQTRGQCKQSTASRRESSRRWVGGEQGQMTGLCGAQSLVYPS